MKTFMAWTICNTERQTHVQRDEQRMEMNRWSSITPFMLCAGRRLDCMERTLYVDINGQKALLENVAAPTPLAFSVKNWGQRDTVKSFACLWFRQS